MSLYWVARSLWRERVTNRPRHSWSRQELEQYQEQALRSLLRLAADRSPFYHRLYKGLNLDTIPLSELPIVTKRDLMDHFDEAVTDRRLTKEALLKFTAQTRPDELFAGEFKVFQTSGTTGVPGIFPYSRNAVVSNLAAMSRQYQMHEVKITLPWRIAMVAGTHPAHLSSGGAAFLNGWPNIVRAIPSDRPMAEVVPELNAYRPHMVLAYPNVMSILLREQAAGRLHIQPRVITLTGEVLPPDLLHRCRQAWPGVTCIETYGFTELESEGQPAPNAAVCISLRTRRSSKSSTRAGCRQRPASRAIAW